jgi:hypothetical protein
MNFKEFFSEAGKILTKQGVDISRVNKQDFLTAKSKLQPVLQKAGLNSYWSAGGAGSFDPEHPYGGGGREDSGDIDILIDPLELVQKFPKDINEYLSELKQQQGPKYKKPAGDENELKLKASKWELAKYMSKNGYKTSPGTLTLQYTVDGRSHSVDLIIRPKSAWEIHTHDFTKDPGMRGGDLWLKIYPLLAKLASKTIFTDPKSGEEKGNLQFSPDRGLVDRDTNQVVADDKNKIAQILLSSDATARDLASLSGIKNKLINQPEKWNAVKQFYSSEIKTESILNEGIEHIEDSIITGGYDGAVKAFKELASLVNNSDTVTIKWDGFPAIIWGWMETPTRQNPSGKFLFVDKHMYDKISKGKLEYTTIEEYDKGRGSNRTSLWEAASLMVPVLKRLTPQKEKQFFFGDLMWSGLPKTSEGYFVFKPNTVEYRVKIETNLGHEISRSVGGIAVHTFIPGLGMEDRPMKGLQGLKQNEGITFLVGEIEEKPRIAIPANILNQAQQTLKQNKAVTQKFIKSLEEIKAKGVLTLMSQFITSMLNENDIANNIVPRFLTFLKHKLSAKQTLNLLGNNQDGWLFREGAPGLLGMWSIWATLTDLKLNVKKQIDIQQTGLPIQARIGEENSHEGYVFGSGKNKLKLIDRLGFSRANFAKNANSKDELEDKSKLPQATFCFGRMNPPTIGHKQLMQKTVEVGGANSFIFLSNTQNAKKDPLSADVKMEFVKKIYPEFASHIVSEKVLNPIHAANYLYAKGFRNLVFVAGSDRLGDNPSSLEKLLTSWNSGPIRTKDFNFGSNGREQVALKFVSSGDRDADSDVNNVSGISASLARKFATEKNETGFHQATGVSNNITVNGKTLYQSVREGLGLPLTESFKTFLSGLV